MMKRNVLLLILLGNTSPLFVGQAIAETSYKCPNESGYYYTNYKRRNPQLGGFVSDSANVTENVFIAKTAAVCENATVTGSARIYGRAVIKGEAEVTRRARVFGDSVVSGQAIITDEAAVSEHAKISGEAVISGDARVRGYARISSGTRSTGIYKPKEPQNEIAARNRREQKARDEAARLAAEREKKSNLAKLRNEETRLREEILGKANTVVTIKNNGSAKLEYKYELGRSGTVPLYIAPFKMRCEYSFKVSYRQIVRNHRENWRQVKDGKITIDLKPRIYYFWGKHVVSLGWFGGDKKSPNLFLSSKSEAERWRDKVKYYANKFCKK